MRKKETSLLETLRNVQQFLDDHAAIVAPVNESGARTKLNEIVAQLTVQAVDQGAGRVTGQSQTAQQYALRRELLSYHMLPVSLVARAQLQDRPEISKLVLPSQQLASTKLVAAAGAMADAAAAHVSTFVEHGLPEDFIAQLNAAAAALAATLDTRNKSVGRSVGATRALAQLGVWGRRVLKILAALVAPKLVGNPRLIGEWQSVKRIHKKSGPTAGSQPVATPTLPPAATPTPVAVTGEEGDQVA